MKRNISWMTLHIVRGAKIRGEINNAKDVNEIKKIVEMTNF